jgi:hypothetical protein
MQIAGFFVLNELQNVECFNAPSGTIARVKDEWITRSTGKVLHATG